MRRPRGPGGRFLTAEEIAAKKVSATDHPSPVDHDMDDDHLQLSPDPDPDPGRSELSPSVPPFIHQSLVNMEYHRHNLSIPLSLHPLPKQRPGPYNPQSLQQTRRHHPPMVSPLEPLTLATPYSRDKMHNVNSQDHPRQQQSSFASYPSMYPTDPDLHQRHTEEMIMYNTPGPSA
jgi:nuclear transcription factor Y, alpha